MSLDKDKIAYLMDKSNWNFRASNVYEYGVPNETGAAALKNVQLTITKPGQNFNFSGDGVGYYVTGDDLREFLGMAPIGKPAGGLVSGDSQVFVGFAWSPFGDTQWLLVTPAAAKLAYAKVYGNKSKMSRGGYNRLNGTYTVSENQSLSDIAQEFGALGRANEIVIANPTKESVVSGNRMFFKSLAAGEVLKVPYGWGRNGAKAPRIAPARSTGLSGARKAKASAPVGLGDGFGGSTNFNQTFAPGVRVQCTPGFVRNTKGTCVPVGSVQQGGSGFNPAAADISCPAGTVGMFNPMTGQMECVFPQADWALFGAGTVVITGHPMCSPTLFWDEKSKKCIKLPSIAHAQSSSHGYRQGVSGPGMGLGDIVGDILGGSGLPGTCPDGTHWQITSGGLIGECVSDSSPQSIIQTGADPLVQYAGKVEACAKQSANWDGTNCIKCTSGVWDYEGKDGPHCYACPPGANYNFDTHQCETLGNPAWGCAPGGVYDPSNPDNPGGACFFCEQEFPGGGSAYSLAKHGCVCQNGFAWGTGANENKCVPVAKSCPAGMTYDPEGDKVSGAGDCYDCHGYKNASELTYSAVDHGCHCPKDKMWNPDGTDSCVPKTGSAPVTPKPANVTPAPPTPELIKGESPKKDDSTGKTLVYVGLGIAVLAAAGIAYMVAKPKGPAAPAGPAAAAPRQLPAARRAPAR